MIRKILLLTVMLLTFATFSSIALAKNEKIVASGLNNPRNMAYGPDGTLYIAEAGKAGDLDGEGPYSPVKYGETGQITAVSPEGEQSVLIPGLISMNSGFGRIDGPTAIYVNGRDYWAVMGIGLKNSGDGKYASDIVQYSRSQLTVGSVIDVGAFETNNNPDQNPDDLASNPTDIAVDASEKFYIADASANDVLTWTAEDGLKLFAAWPVAESEPAAVPTAVAIGPDGDIYVGFLTGFPFQPETSRIEVYGADGALKKTYKGLSFLTDVQVTEDGTIYAVQFSEGYGDQGWVPGTGRILMVSDDSIETVADQLNFPYGMAISADGQIVVNVDTFGAGEDGGSVIAIDSP